MTSEGIRERMEWHMHFLIFRSEPNRDNRRDARVSNGVLRYDLVMSMSVLMFHPQALPAHLTAS